MRKLDTIVWLIGARYRRLSISSVTPVWGTGTPLATWLSQTDLWARGAADRSLVELCEVVQRYAGDTEHQVLNADEDAITLCSRIDPAAARDRLAFLAEASAFLGASTDLSTVATAASRLALPGLADWCVLRLSPALENVQRLLVGHREWDREKEIRDIERRRHLRNQWAGTLRGDQCTLTIETATAPAPATPSAEGEGDSLTRARRSETEIELLGRGLTSEITVDLHGQHGRLGRLTFASTRRTARYGIFDLVVATAFGQRVATALEQAALVRRSVSETLRRDQLLATVSHDLRNPLTAILAGTQGLLASEGPATSPGRHRRLEAIRRSAERMNRLTEDLLAVAQLERGGIVLKRAANSVQGMLAEAGALFEPLAAQRAQTLVVSTPTPDIVVKCDSDRMLQVLSNLMVNALKFTPEHGRIELRAWLVRDHVCFSVADDGPGIPAGNLAHVFDVGWQATPCDHRGLGLGLAIAKALVLVHGGDIWAESRVGAGATFFFTLPLDVTSAGVGSGAPARRSRTPTPKLFYSAPLPAQPLNARPAR
jgi:signal transduction histidine kinase